MCGYSHSMLRTFAKGTIDDYTYMIHASVYKRRNNNHFTISVMLMVVHCIQTCFVTTHLPFKLNPLI